MFKETALSWRRRRFVRDFASTSFTILVFLSYSLKLHLATYPILSDVSGSQISSQGSHRPLQHSSQEQHKKHSALPNHIPYLFLPTPSPPPIFPQAICNVRQSSSADFSCTPFSDRLGIHCLCPARRWPWALLSCAEVFSRLQMSGNLLWT